MGIVFFMEVGIKDLPAVFETSELILTVNGFNDNFELPKEDCILMAI
jgi:hypothetical protein